MLSVLYLTIFCKNTGCYCRTPLPRWSADLRRPPSVYSALVREETSRRRGRDHVMRRIVGAPLDQSLGPVTHDGQRQTQEAQHGGGESQQTGQQTGPDAH